MSWCNLTCRLYFLWHLLSTSHHILCITEDLWLYRLIINNIVYFFNENAFPICNIDLSFSFRSLVLVKKNAKFCNKFKSERLTHILNKRMFSVMLVVLCLAQNNLMMILCREDFDMIFFQFWPEKAQDLFLM